MSNPASRDQQSRAPSLDYIFHPRSIAAVGLSTDPSQAWLNECYVDSPLKIGYSGQLYPINPKGGQIAGLPVYPSLKDVPGPVDYVVCCIPARQTLKLLEECRDKGVKVVQLYTAGFAETGEPEGIELQGRLVETARRSGIRLIGPNCMGIYCPASGMSFCMDYPPEGGPIGLLCQGGGNTSYIVRSAVARGLRFSKAVSYGNACDINECDLLEYMADDQETKAIAAYIEGTTDGQRFVEALARAASVKPVVVFKGGYTEGGSRATVSHTGSLAGDDAVWDGLLRQVGAIRVYSVEEMVDVLVALLQMIPPRGANACVIGVSGSASVLATDECERAKLRLPPIPPETRDRLKELIPLAGSMLRNPIDIFPFTAAIQGRLLAKQTLLGWESALREMRVARGDQGWGDLIEVLEDWREIDLLIFHLAFDMPPVTIQEGIIGPAVGQMMVAARTCRLPVAMVLHSITNDNSWRVLQRTKPMCLEAGLPLFLSMRGAAQAIRRLIDFNKAYPEKLARLQGLL